MKKAILVTTSLMILLGAAFVSAQALTLTDAMRTIGKEFRTLNETALDPAQKALATESARRMAAGFVSAKDIIPISVLELASDEQAAMIQRYTELIQDGANLSEELAVALEQDRTADVEILLEKLGDLRKTGHREFR